MSMWSLPPGGWFKHSDEHKSYYFADESYLILDGEMTIHNPETGDVAVVRAGEGLAFRERTWHYGYNATGEETMLIGILAPVPDNIADNEELAAQVPPLTEIRNGRWDLFADETGGFPWNVDRAVATNRFRRLDRRDWLHVIQGEEHPLRVDLVCATDRLTSGLFTLLPGFISDPESHPGDEVAFCVEGQAAVQLTDTGEWLELNRRDGCFIPGGRPPPLVQHHRPPGRRVLRSRAPVPVMPRLRRSLRGSARPPGSASPGPRTSCRRTGVEARSAARGRPGARRRSG